MPPMPPMLSCPFRAAHRVLKGGEEHAHLRNRAAAQRAKPFVAQSIGVAERELVVVKHGDKFRLTTKASLEKWISSKNAA